MCGLDESTGSLQPLLSGKDFIDWGSRPQDGVLCPKIQRLKTITDLLCEVLSRSEKQQNKTKQNTQAHTKKPPPRWKSQLNQEKFQTSRKEWSEGVMSFLDDQQGEVFGEASVLVVHLKDASTKPDTCSRLIVSQAVWLGHKMRRKSSCASSCGCLDKAFINRTGSGLLPPCCYVPGQWLLLSPQASVTVSDIKQELPKR